MTKPKRTGASVSRTRRPRRGATTDPRVLAWEVLQQVETGAYADALLGTRLAGSSMEPRDQGLATRLVYGTIAWQRYLDHLLAGFCHRPLVDLDPPIRTALRLGMYQVCILDKIPGFAAVDTAVSLAKRHRGGMAAGFVNAVLRRATKSWRGVPLPAAERDLAGYLSVRFSHPRWLVERWLAVLGAEETRALLLANNEPAPTSVRVNRRKRTREQLQVNWETLRIQVRAGIYSPLCLQIEGLSPERLPGYEDGLLTPQGESSQLIGLLVSPEPGNRILDACAAPGGKATHLAELIDDTGEIIALDIHESGTQRIRETARRLGLSCVRAVTADVLAWQPPEGGFDRILVDAPCSGFGTLREHPEVRWRRTPEDVERLATMQLLICRRVVPWLRPGGVLVYSTCTLMPEENEQIAARILSEFPDLHPEDAGLFLPVEARELAGVDGTLRTFPHRGGLDGFYAVRLRRANRTSIVPA